MLSASRGLVQPPGLSVVVSPLAIALMKDQVDALQTLGVSAGYINSSLSGTEVRERQAAISRGEIKILYVAPERLMMPSFLGWLKKERNVSLFAIDEGPTVSRSGATTSVQNIASSVISAVLFPDVRSGLLRPRPLHAFRRTLSESWDFRAPGVSRQLQPGHLSHQVAVEEIRV